MKKVNIQNDLDSRKEISRTRDTSLFTVREKNNVESSNLEQHAESKDLQKCENHPSGVSEPAQKTKKRRSA
ncbi:hypothetical protein J8L13_16355 [Bacteroides fragilis]|nr:hypothetical protein [Bacteroides fragilis]